MQTTAFLVGHAPLMALIALRGTSIVAPTAAIAAIAAVTGIPTIAAAAGIPAVAPGALALNAMTITVRRAPALRCRERRRKQPQNSYDQEHLFHGSVPQRSACHM